jgi:hypothetical protein
MNRSLLLHVAATTLVASGSLFAQSQPVPPTPAVAPTPPVWVAGQRPDDAKLRATLREVSALLDKDDLSDAERAAAKKKLKQALDRLKASDEAPLAAVVVPNEHAVVMIDGEKHVYAVPAEGAVAVVPPTPPRAPEAARAPRRLRLESFPVPPEAPTPPAAEEHEQHVRGMRARIAKMKAEIDEMSAGENEIAEVPLVLYRRAAKAAGESAERLLEVAVVEEHAEHAKAHAEHAKAHAERAAEADVYELRSRAAQQAKEEGGKAFETARVSLERAAKAAAGSRPARAAEADDDGEVKALVEELRAELREIRNLVRELRQGTEEVERGAVRVRSGTRNSPNGGSSSSTSGQGSSDGSSSGGGASSGEGSSRGGSLFPARAGQNGLWSRAAAPTKGAWRYEPGQTKRLSVPRASLRWGQTPAGASARASDR